MLHFCVPTPPTVNRLQIKRPKLSRVNSSPQGPVSNGTGLDLRATAPSSEAGQWVLKSCKWNEEDPGQRTAKLRPHVRVWQACDRPGLHKHKPLFQLLIDPFSILDCSLAIWFSSWGSTSFFFLLSVLDWFTTTSGTVSGQSHGNPGPLRPFIALCCFFDLTLTKLVLSYKEVPKGNVFLMPSCSRPTLVQREKRGWENCCSRTVSEGSHSFSHALCTQKRGWRQTLRPCRGLAQAGMARSALPSASKSRGCGGRSRLGGGCGQGRRLWKLLQRFR